MYPPTHVAFAYLTGRKTVPKPITGTDVWLLAFFALLPDLGDKIIHYQFGLFTSGRNIFHNIFIILFSFGLYRLLKPGFGRRLALIMFIGLGTHFAGDLIVSLIGWTYKDYSSIPDWYLYMLFPIFDPRLLPIRFDWIGFTWELIFVLVAISIWIRDGIPGLAFRKSADARLNAVNPKHPNGESPS